MSRLLWDNENTSDCVTFPVMFVAVSSLDFHAPWQEHVLPMIGYVAGLSLLAAVLIFTLDYFFPKRKRTMQNKTLRFIIDVACAPAALIAMAFLLGWPDKSINYYAAIAVTAILYIAIHFALNVVLRYFDK